MTSPATISTLSPAKINLFLHITGKRDDGYHNLQTVFRLLNWGDDMRFVASQDRFDNFKLADFNPQIHLPNHLPIHLPVRLHCDIQLTDNPADNLIIKSAIALLDYYKQKTAQTNPKATDGSQTVLPIIDIHLTKKIPTGAGLGGGSSNAATTLMALNQLWNLAISQDELIGIGATLGADVPIFIFGDDAIAEGIGEILTPIDLPKQRFLLLTPTAHIATAQLFAHPQLCREMPQLPLTHIKQQTTEFTNLLNAPYTNVFEAVVSQLSPEVAQAIAYLRQFEADNKSTARMTGSGSCVFLPIADTIPQTRIQTWIDNAPCPAYIIDSL